jgi:hypothetical protein
MGGTLDEFGFKTSVLPTVRQAWTFYPVVFRLLHFKFKWQSEDCI